MFVFAQCTDVVVEDLQIQDSSAWTLNPQYSQRLSFRRLTITAPALGSHGHNTDGFDPWACQDVEFIDSYYSGGDDCVAVKSGKDANASSPWPCGSEKYPAHNIRINNITCDGSHGLTIGSEMSGGVDGVSFTNIDIRNSGPSVRIKSQCGRRAYVRNVLYENITADNVGNAVWIDMMYFSKVDTCSPEDVSTFENITVRNLHVDHITGNGAAYEIVGLALTGGSDELPIRGITLDNVTVAHYGSPGECTHANVSTIGISPPLPRGDGCGGVEVACAVDTSQPMGCYDDSTTQGLGMQFQAQVHDHTTLERCAAACFRAKMPLTAIDAGNHCFCGAKGALAKDSKLVRPLAECETSSCYSNKTQKCGGKGRLLTYSYKCS